MDAITVVIVAGTAISRTGIRTWLESAPDIKIVGEADDVASLTAYLSEYTVDVVIVRLGGGLELAGLEVVELTKALQPTSKVLLLSPVQELNKAVDHIVSGADAYLSFHVDQGDLVQSVRNVMQYGLIISEDIVPMVRERLANDEFSSMLARVTSREREILREVAMGKNNKEIATELNISCDTVRTHLRHIYRKLNLDNRSALIAFAIQSGIGKINIGDREQK